MEDQLLDLYAVLTRDAARCQLFALRAGKENQPEAARLLRALALSLSRQAHRFLMQIRGSVADCAGNSREILECILPDSISRYETLLTEAEQRGSRAIATSMQDSRSVQLKNRALMQQLRAGKTGTGYAVCNFCGFVATGQPPEFCPICTAPAHRFDRIES